MTKHKIYLGLGSNLGDRQGNISRAYAEIEKLIGSIVRQSALYESEPWGFESDNSFINSVICCETTLSPREVLKITQFIERLLGRTQKSVDGHYHDRTIDIDILLYDDFTVNEPDLKIPHPLMRQRDFVMNPLSEIFE
ncbi:MAG: 2-amino-4-hydroxy-6-hydroxymethyldihydropteridine diphosphokinase [Prevotella sp.]|nr:2-amino-4-hydroxy-6-hydroxymethyldihydropteridine diphosphokinase [Prevotella sp.]